ncbi:MAG: rRNA maturation RNase YbeY [Planctomycetota bacterium]
MALIDEDDDPISIEVRFETEFPVDANLHSFIVAAARQAANARNAHRGTLGVLICDDAKIRELNQRHLQHDYATDVISFGYQYQPPFVEGELVASLETATRQARVDGNDFDGNDFDGNDIDAFNARHELLLYVVHGTLHICGMDDHDAAERLRMRHFEKQVFEQLGIVFPAEVDSPEALR